MISSCPAMGSSAHVPQPCVPICEDSVGWVCCLCGLLLDPLTLQTAQTDSTSHSSSVASSSDALLLLDDHTASKRNRVDLHLGYVASSGQAMAIKRRKVSEECARLLHLFRLPSSIASPALYLLDEFTREKYSSARSTGVSLRLRVLLSCCIIVACRHRQRELLAECDGSTGSGKTSKEHVLAASSEESSALNLSLHEVSTLLAEPTVTKEICSKIVSRIARRIHRTAPAPSVDLYIQQYAHLLTWSETTPIDRMFQATSTSPANSTLRPLYAAINLAQQAHTVVQTIAGHNDHLGASLSSSNTSLAAAFLHVVLHAEPHCRHWSLPHRASCGLHGYLCTIAHVSSRSLRILSDCIRKAVIKFVTAHHPLLTSTSNSMCSSSHGPHLDVTASSTPLRKQMHKKRTREVTPAASIDLALAHLDTTLRWHALSSSPPFSKAPTVIPPLSHVLSSIKSNTKETSGTQPFCSSPLCDNQSEVVLMSVCNNTSDIDCNLDDELSEYVRTDEEMEAFALTWSSIYDMDNIPSATAERRKRKQQSATVAIQEMNEHEN